MAALTARHGRCLVWALFSVFCALDALEGLAVGFHNFHSLVLLRCMFNCLEVLLALFNAYKNARYTCNGAHDCAIAMCKRLRVC
jgi:hypothetical protein